MAELDRDKTSYGMFGWREQVLFFNENLFILISELSTDMVYTIHTYIHMYAHDIHCTCIYSTWNYIHVHVYSTL